MAQYLPRIVAFVGVLLLLPSAGCAAEQENTGENATPPSPAAPPSNSVDPANATYAGIYDDPVSLVDGLYEGPPFVEGGASRPRLELVKNLRVDADLDGDGAIDTAVLLTENSGGSGTFSYVAVLESEQAEGQNTRTALVGVCVQIKRFYVGAGKLALDVVQSGPNDPACCPTQSATLTWALRGGELRAAGRIVTGTLSRADISGIDWRLISINSDEPAPNTIKITLRIDGDRVSGKSACNSYTGAVTGDDEPGRLSFGPIGGTKMLCPEPIMAWETRYLNALQNAQQFRFEMGNLVVGGVANGEYVSLRFSREGSE